MLTEADLPELTRLLDDIAYSSWDLGIQLGLKLDLVKKLEYEAGRDASRFISSVLGTWLQQPRLLQTLVGAISTRPVDNEGLAIELQQHFSAV